jgi:biopolymer transport protein ExbD
MSTIDRPLYTRLSKMRRKYQPENRIAKGLIDAGPLVDVVLLVFLFFLVSSSFVLQPGIRMNLPESPFAAGASYRSLVVAVSQEGMIFFNDERTTLDGLASVFSQAVHDNPDAALLIEADGRVRHSVLVEIYNMAVAAGIEQITLGTQVSPIDGRGL